MKIKWVLIILIINSLGYDVIFAKQNVTIYGDDNYPPYSYLENGQAKGIYVDVLKLTFSKMPEYKVIIKMTPWKRGLSCIKRGECLALFPPYQVEKRRPWMMLSEPILEEQIVVFGTVEKLKEKTKWPQDFLGFQIGLNNGFSPHALGGHAFGEACKAKKIVIQEAKSNDHNLKKLETGRIDFYLNDRLIDISKYPTIKRGTVTNVNYGHLGFTRVNKNFKYLYDFKNKFDTIIKEIKQSNQIENIILRYMK